MEFILNPGKLSFDDIHLLLDHSTTITLSPACHEKILSAGNVIADVIKNNKTVYGINTGFGALASTPIQQSDLINLQRHIVLSHAAGTGELLSDHAVRLMLALKINSLARGYSGVRLETILMLIQFFNLKCYPCVPSQGSVGASGDLAPLAHLSLPLLGLGEMRVDGKIYPAHLVLEKNNLKPLTLAPKEGLALLNGTQTSTALAILGLFGAEKIFCAAITAGALSIEAARGTDVPYDHRIHAVRGHQSQIAVAAVLRELLHDSGIRKPHQSYTKVQDPYSLRCQPQVMGACLSHLLHVGDTLLTEANAVSDNPLIFSEQNDILSGGNFHAEPVAIASDTLAISIAEIAALSERRIALLIDAHFSGLPAFLVKNSGVNSGFMMAHVTAAALASENKSLAHPASIDSLPTSANQEDHVSMATFAARRLLAMIDNASVIVGIELLAACQGIDLLRPLSSSKRLEEVHAFIRQYISYYDQDRYFSPDITQIKNLLLSGEISKVSRLTINDFKI